MILNQNQTFIFLRFLSLSIIGMGCNVVVRRVVRGGGLRLQKNEKLEREDVLGIKKKKRELNGINSLFYFILFHVSLWGLKNA